MVICWGIHCIWIMVVYGVQGSSSICTWYLAFIIIVYYFGVIYFKVCFSITEKVQIKMNDEAEVMLLMGKL